MAINRVFLLGTVTAIHDDFFIMDCSRRSDQSNPVVVTGSSEFVVIGKDIAIEGSIENSNIMAELYHELPKIRNK